MKENNLLHDQSQAACEIVPKKSILLLMPFKGTCERELELALCHSLLSEDCDLQGLQM